MTGHFQRKFAFVIAAMLIIMALVSYTTDTVFSAKSKSSSTKGKKSSGKTDYAIIGKAPGFAIKDLSGKTVNWSQYKGKVVLVDFWATWCGPCRRSIPHLSDLHTKYADKGFEVVGISLDQAGVEAVAKFAKSMNIPYTVLMGTVQLAMDWGVGGGIPMAFLVDREGNIVDKILGYQEQSIFEQKIEKFL